MLLLTLPESNETLEPSAESTATAAGDYCVCRKELVAPPADYLGHGGVADQLETIAGPCESLCGEA